MKEGGRRGQVELLSKITHTLRSNSQKCNLLLAKLLEHRVRRALLRLVEDAPLGKRRCAQTKGGGSGQRDTTHAERSGAEDQRGRASLRCHGAMQHRHKRLDAHKLGSYKGSQLARRLHRSPTGPADCTA